MYYIQILIFLLLSLFILYSLSKNDFVLLRKNVSVSFISDRLPLIVLISFIFARVFYILESGNYSLFNVLRFFYITKFHGFSTIGFIVGIALSLFILFRKYGVLLRLYDIFSLSIFPIYLISTLFFPLSGWLLILNLLVFSLSILLFILFLKFHKNYTLNDGSTALFVIVVFSLYHFLLQFFGKEKIMLYFLTLSQWITIFVFSAAIILVVINERIYLRNKK